MPNIRPINAGLTKVAAKELNEVPERIQSDIDAFREWILKSPHLKARTDDQFLIAFLRGCKYSLERAKTKIDMFYTTRTLLPEIVLNRDPMNDRLAAIIRCGVGIPLPLTEKPDSPKLILIRPGAFDPNVFTIQEVFKISTMIQDILLREDDNYCISGEIGIIDLANVTMGHFMQFNPTFIKKITVMSQEGGPIRQKGLHFLNIPYGFESVFNVFKTFMSEKNRKRLYVHGINFEAFHKVIPKRLLPKEYGGEVGSIQKLINDWEKKFMSYREFFLEEEQFGTDEKKRNGYPHNTDNVFGVNGTFRKLAID